MMFDAEGKRVYRCRHTKLFEDTMSFGELSPFWQELHYRKDKEFKEPCSPQCPPHAQGLIEERDYCRAFELREIYHRAGRQHEIESWGLKWYGHEWREQCKGIMTMKQVKE